MIGLESLRWSLTLAFAVATGFHLARLLRPGAGAERISDALHLLMGGSMIVMIWPWGGGVPAGVWAAGFTVSTGWFAARAVRAGGWRFAEPGVRWPVCTAAGAAAVYFATSAAAMVWMSVAMPAPHQHHLGTAEPAIGPATGPDIGPAAAWVSAALGGYLVAAALWWVARGMRLAPAGPHGATPHWPALCHAMMSAAMGLALLAMA
ncbi:DUF5134 domain-containing protein [Paractinoplanes rhizophilus]|jgi:hypothetical protein|uniref:DUF5134 domain-containing protein n=1 Tax=Paractinoplanes rhizophilus TaxID=1416877 RepID=A0ABW2I2D9_9ACTN|nr:DUF5134 domain-containing protein [Actinoplanes sp.]